jgi:hypothetical protein
MPEGDHHGQTPERYEETRDPRNPPNSVVNREVRRTALRVYLGPIIALFFVVGLGLIYWANRSPIVREDPALVGTSGDQQDVVGERGNDSDTPGGFNPNPRPDNTRDELKFRGARIVTDLRAIASRDAAAAQPVDIRGATVVDVKSPTLFWVQDGDARVAVSAPDGRRAPERGSTVNVRGVVESDDQGGLRIRASSVD